MTPVEELREASSLMRERAEAATQGPYIIDSIESGEHALFIDRDPDPEGLGCGGAEVAGWLTEANAQHFASWHPTMAIAVADLLVEASLDWPEYPAALAVARAYLRSES